MSDLKSSNPVQNSQRNLSDEQKKRQEEEKRRKFVKQLRGGMEGWMAFIQDEAIKHCIEAVCLSFSYARDRMDDFTQTLYVVLLEFNYAETWSKNIEEGGFRDKNNEWRPIRSVTGWLEAVFMNLMNNTQFLGMMIGDPGVIRNTNFSYDLSFVKSDDDGDDGDDGDDDDGNYNYNDSDSDNGIEWSQQLDSEEQNRQLRDTLDKVGETPRAGQKYKVFIERYYINHDDLRLIAADFLKEGWTTTDDTKDPIGAVARTLQNRTAPKVRQCFDRIAEERGYACRLKGFRRTKPESEKKRKRKKNLMKS